MRFIPLFAMVVLAQAQQPRRPKITGLARAAFYVKSIDAARVFYQDFLGYRESSPNVLQVNERQSIELVPEKEAATDRLHHISFETEDAAAMRAYLASKGVKALAAPSNNSVSVKDPDGHTIEFVHTARGPAKALGPQRVSTHMLHAGILVGSTQASMKFYRDLLGFREFWRGSRDGKLLSWINMKVPDGEDYLEFMLYAEMPQVSRMGVQHHICLEVPDMDNAIAELQSRGRFYDQDIEPRTGTNRRRQANLYDPDRTRVELMEPRTVDGVPTPSATAPPPRP